MNSILKNKKIIFLLESTTAVYSFKRINGFMSKGVDVEIYGIESIIVLPKNRATS